VVTVRSFEVVHGISRVVKLLPDKLATAISVCSEELHRPRDNGAFLIRIVEDLVISQ
jgi:hypothetical protein